MQRVALSLDRQRTLLARAAGPLVTCALGASLLLSPVAYAQVSTPEATPAATPATEQVSATVTDLYSYELEAFPTAPVSVRLLRITLQPGASSPMHTHPGPEFDLVESGTLTVTTEGDADLSRGGGEPVTGPLTGEQLGEGDLVVFPGGTAMTLVNDSDQEVVILSAVFHPVQEDVRSTTYTDGDPEADAFDGVSFRVLGDGIIQSFPEGAATIGLQEVTVPGGTDLPGTTGAAVYSLVDGSFAFAVQDGDVQVSRTDSPGLRPNAAPEQEFTLAPGDAAFFPSGVADATRADQGGDLSVLRLTAEPATAFTANAAAISFMPESAATDDGTEGGSPDSFTEIAVGAPVVTNTDTVNLRAEPSTAADAVDQLDEGTSLTVIGGPEEADDFTWWQVQVDDTDAEGWVAVDFIDLVGGPEETAEPVAATPDATPDATPGATPQPGEGFAEGDIVVTSEDNVRIRDAASTDGEPIDAFPQGTQFEVTGEPEEADDYTWYPVTLVSDDSVEGWIASDFLEPAEEEEEG